MLKHVKRYFIIWRFSWIVVILSLSQFLFIQQISVILVVFSYDVHAWNQNTIWCICVERRLEVNINPGSIVNILQSWLQTLLQCSKSAIWPRLQFPKSWTQPLALIGDNWLAIWSLRMWKFRYVYYSKVCQRAAQYCYNLMK